MTLLSWRCPSSRSQRAVVQPSKATSERSRLRRLAALAAASLVLLIPVTARSETAPARVADVLDPWSAFVMEAAERFAIPVAWIRAVMRIESGGNAKALSPKGAVGLMQIMPATYAELRARYALGDDPADPHDNIVAGAAYLRQMYDRFGASGFLAAYNVGPERYEEHLVTGRVLPDETQTYVAMLAPLLSGMVFPDSATSPANPRDWQKASLFVARSTRKADDALLSLTPRAMRIKTDRNVADLSALAPLPDGLFVSKAKSPSQP